MSDGTVAGGGQVYPEKKRARSERLPVRSLGGPLSPEYSFDEKSPITRRY